MAKEKEPSKHSLKIEAAKEKIEAKRKQKIDWLKSREKSRELREQNFRKKVEDKRTRKYLDKQSHPEKYVKKPSANHVKKVADRLRRSELRKKRDLKHEQKIKKLSTPKE